MIRRAVIGLLLVAAWQAGSLQAGAINRDLLRTPSGLTVEMVFRATQPGEPLCFILEDGAGLPRCTVEFLGHTAVLRPQGTRGRAIAFLGIDLGVKPGTYPLELRSRTRAGVVETVHRDLIVAAREFPTQKLWLRRDMVTPPKSMQETIKRESEILSWIFSTTTPDWLGDGAFAVPSRAAMSPNFGERRIVNNIQESIHSGIDVMTPFGDPIRAVNSGEVALAGNMYFSGKTVIIDHGLGVFSFYCHLSKLLVKRGMTVKKGEVVGECGSTGRSTGPHLHWAMRVLDSRVDPEAMLLFPLDEASSGGAGRGGQAAGKRP